MDRYGHLPDLDSLRCFVEAARTLNFRAASKAVALTPAALGQRIRQLEDQLEVKLFHRTTRKVELTEAGLALLPAAREALDSAWSCTRAARGELGPAPMELRLGTRHELGLSWVLPLLLDLEAAHPALTIHLYFGSGPDLELRVRSQEVDCAISSRRLTDPRLDGIRIHQEDYLLVGSPELLASNPLEVPEHATNHVLVDTSPEVPLFRYWRDAPGAPPLSFGGILSMGTIEAICWAVLQGKGVAVLPEYLIRSKLERGLLSRVLPEIEPLHDWFRLFHRKDDPRVPLFRAMVETMAGHPLS